MVTVTVSLYGDKWIAENDRGLRCIGDTKEEAERKFADGISRVTKLRQSGHTSPNMDYFLGLSDVRGKEAHGRTVWNSEDRKYFSWAIVL
jgi:hypothetical protein